jgi:hypothetical protein
MKLYVTFTSPYARLVRIVVLEMMNAPAQSGMNS